MRLKIAGGRLYDPACGWDGEVGDLYIEAGRLVPPLLEVDRVIEARGQVVTPAGIELRGQVATYGLDFLRLSNGAPSLAELGESYALLGYTHVHEPFLTAWTAGYVQRQLGGSARGGHLRLFGRQPAGVGSVFGLAGAFGGGGANPPFFAGRDPFP